MREGGIQLGAPFWQRFYHIGDIPTHAEVQSLYDPGRPSFSPEDLVFEATDDDDPELMATAQSMLAAYVDVDVNDTLVNDDTEMVAGPGHGLATHGALTTDLGAADEAGGIHQERLARFQINHIVVEGRSRGGGEHKARDGAGECQNVTTHADSLKGRVTWRRRPHLRHFFTKVTIFATAPGPFWVRIVR